MWGTDNLTQRAAHNLQAIGRLKPNVSPQQADEDVRTVVARMERENPTTFPGVTSWCGGAQRLLEAKVDPMVRKALWILRGATILVLLIGCLNLASLLLGRGVARRREIAIRLALSVSRRGLVRQLLTEPMLLALLGGVCGLLLASWGMRLLGLMLPEAERAAWAWYSQRGGRRNQVWEIGMPRAISVQHSALSF